MEIRTTQRGFAIADFTDAYGVECSIQKSSLADKDAIWLGANKLDIKEWSKETGWVKHPEFDEGTLEHHYVGNARMHLTREQVAELLPILQRFVETGEIYGQSED
jgi:hypothetical protein